MSVILLKEKQAKLGFHPKLIVLLLKVIFF